VSARAARSGADTVRLHGFVAEYAPYDDMGVKHVCMGWDVSILFDGGVRWSRRHRP
jgi:hypothetical protein